MIDRGVERINRELEVDQFLKSQIKMRIMMKALFSKAERYLIRNNKKFVLKKDPSDG